MLHRKCWAHLVPFAQILLLFFVDRIWIFKPLSFCATDCNATGMRPSSCKSGAMALNWKKQDGSRPAVSLWLKLKSSSVLGCFVDEWYWNLLSDWQTERSLVDCNAGAESSRFTRPFSFQLLLVIMRFQSRLEKWVPRSKRAGGSCLSWVAVFSVSEKVSSVL